MVGRSLKYYYYCKTCGKYYKHEECPLYQSKVQLYPVCPSCPTKYKLRKRPHNKRWKEYYQQTMILPILSTHNGL